MSRAEELLSNVSQVLVDAAHPKRIILFGSRARGDARDDSDFDVMVVEEQPPDRLREMVRLNRLLCKFDAAIDLLVVSEDRFQYWRDTPGNVYHEAATHGRTLYECTDYRSTNAGVRCAKISCEPRPPASDRLVQGSKNVLRSSSMVKLLRRFANCLLWVVVAVVALACLGAVYQVTGTWIDARNFPPEGRPVRIGSRTFNLNCSGKGKPTVILDSALGVPSVGWRLVQPRVAAFARVCSYDRAGYGWSDSGPQPRTSLRIARELKALLDAAGEGGPYILVGHSFGGFN